MMKKAAKHPDAPASHENVNPDYQAESDASALTRAQEIRDDETRHQAALRHLKKQAGNSKKTISVEKVKKGLAAAFPNNTPAASPGGD
jgi:hypothetical protein